MHPKNGEFSLVKIKLAYFHLLPYIVPKKDLNPLLVHKDNLPEELVCDTTDLKYFKEPVMATLLLNFFFVIYYGQIVEHGDVTSNEMKAKMIHLGTGYKLKVRIV
jgi:hypothetical protein